MHPAKDAFEASSRGVDCRCISPPDAGHRLERLNDLGALPAIFPRYVKLGRPHLLLPRVDQHSAGVARGHRGFSLWWVVGHAPRHDRKEFEINREILIA